MIWIPTDKGQKLLYWFKCIFDDNEFHNFSLFFYSCSLRLRLRLYVNVRCWSCQLSFLLQIARNITTNEMANAVRYSYLRGSGGRFRNPYDHGIRKNCSDFLINGYNVDDENVEAADPDGIGMTQMGRNSNLQNGDVHSHITNGHGHEHGHDHDHVAINVKNCRSHHGHVHSSRCSQNNKHGKTESVPVGLGIGLGRNTTRSVVASWSCPLCCSLVIECTVCIIHHNTSRVWRNSIEYYSPHFHN